MFEGDEPTELRQLADPTCEGSEIQRPLGELAVHFGLVRACMMFLDREASTTRFECDGP